MASVENTEEKLQMMKMSVHCAVGSICERKKETDGISFSRQFIATVTDLTMKQISLFAEDLELFAKHAKRSVIKPDDVKLLVRKSPELVAHINDIAEKLLTEDKEEKDAKKKAAGQTKRKKSNPETAGE